MHVSFFTDQMDAMRDFYTDRLGFKTRIVTKAKAYFGREGHFAKLAESDPEKVIIVYLEAAPGQFIELFPKAEGQKAAPEYNSTLGYSHFSLLVDDIFEAREELAEKGVQIDTEISKGPSETYKFWIRDPDGNRIEIMQFTERSYQIVGHLM